LCCVLCLFFELVLKAVKTAVLFNCIFCRMNVHFIQNVLGKACKSYTEMLYDNVNTKYFPASYHQFEAKVLPGRASMQVDEWQEYSQKKFHAKLEWLAHNSQKFSLISSKTSGKAQWVSSYCFRIAKEGDVIESSNAKQRSLFACWGKHSVCRLGHTVSDKIQCSELQNTMQSEEQQSISQNCKIVRCEPLRRLQRVLLGGKIIHTVKIWRSSTTTSPKAVVHRRT